MSLRSNRETIDKLRNRDSSPASHRVIQEHSRFIISSLDEMERDLCSKLLNGNDNEEEIQPQTNSSESLLPCDSIPLPPLLTPEYIESHTFSDIWLELARSGWSMSKSNFDNKFTYISPDKRTEYHSEEEVLIFLQVMLGTSNPVGEIEDSESQSHLRIVKARIIEFMKDQCGRRVGLTSIKTALENVSANWINIALDVLVKENKLSRRTKGGRPYYMILTSPV
mmetsp:Transcript_25445/g.37511  ORF Transcript_25445/g.37511 Transcript_25445/m.37511 type:complete len:224 (+) Transcript_25445:151-822(+)|eukprot:CAMPEP_0185039632 /NCGR_PEP_ID=MMETSP1103-20130426/36691_1 /TAXON_ID=36769 /ORGANISM="Paraphysomonas bandaiensis, Strain Caron Lab Isolate" /LENGTH=223 /DNA_ID=CAMNT_0027578595 /DNA_START=62 /DNA_END=733 /DNA_ORIENTATION=-